jgi:peptidoglycan hydrolase-like protein with peptidoglycan-binding domain
MTLTMFDSINVADIPSTGMDAVAGYVGGNWPTFPALVKRFPHLPALSIAVNASQDAQCLDVEKGDATPADVPFWLDKQARLHPDRTPIIYTSASQIAAVRAAAGRRRYLLWSAHYGSGQHICGSCGYPGADATQFDDHGAHGEHIDRTIMSPAFLAAFAPPPPKVPVIVRASRSLVRVAIAVLHRTGLLTEKPWGAFPLPASDWYGIDDHTPHSHSGVNPADQRAVKQIQREIGAKADGGFGPVTAGLVVAYQRRRKILPADGAVGVHTWTDMDNNN